jgi:hypothetical protein
MGGEHAGRRAAIEHHAQDEAGVAAEGNPYVAACA